MRNCLVNQQCLTRKLLQLSLLCAMMLMPKHAWAQTFSGGDGSSTSPYQISTYEDLKALSEYVDGSNEQKVYFELTNDIDCYGKTDFLPIGKYEGNKPFEGYFDGKGHKISNLSYSKGVNSISFAGLFGVIGWEGSGNEGCYVKNLILEFCSFSDADYNGAIAGLLVNGTIDNCTVLYNTINGSNYSGGIVGSLSNGTISNCTVDGSNINSTTDNNIDASSGGIVASIGSSVSGPQAITGCKVKGYTTINAEDKNDYTNNNNNNPTLFSGAIIGDKYTGTFTNNYYYKSVTTSTKVGNVVVQKTDYEQRGTGAVVNTVENQPFYDITSDNGAMLYSKLLTWPSSPITNGNVTVGDYSVGNAQYYIEVPIVKTRSYFAPGDKVEFSIQPESGYLPSSVKVAYGKTVIDASVKEISNGQYNYSFIMPDEEASVSITLVSGTGYDLYLGSKQVTTDNASDVLGDGKTSFTYDATNNSGTLTLNGVALTAPIMSGLSTLTIDLQGTNTITTYGEAGIDGLTGADPSLVITSTSQQKGYLTIRNTNPDNSCGGVIGSGFRGDNSFSIDRSLALYKPNGYYYLRVDTTHLAQIVPSYGLTVSDQVVCELNANDVFGDGTVRFNKSNHTLTLNNASIGSISTSLSELDIDLIGNNSMGTYYNGAVFDNPFDDTNLTINVKSTAAQKGCLSLYLEYNSPGQNDPNGSSGFVDNGITLTVESPLTIFGDLDATYHSHAMIAEPVDYELYVGDVKVTAANTSNITNNLNYYDRPEASFDRTTNTLTLDGYSFSYMYSNVPIKSNIQNLKVKLIGKNVISLGSTKKVFVYSGNASESAPIVTLSTEGDIQEGKYVLGSLEVSGYNTVPDASDLVDGYTIATNYEQVYQEINGGTSTGWKLLVSSSTLKLWYLEVYGITVKKDDHTVSVTNANRLDVLGDADPNNNKPATVQFDGRSRLVLNGADLTSIVVSGTNNLPESGLDVYLEGNNKITNALGYAIESEGAAAMEKLAFYTGGDAPGTLTYTNSGAASENVFFGFNVTYNNNLAKFVDGNVTLVRMPLGLFVNEVGTPAVVTYTSSPAGEDNIPLDNDIFGKMLYTLDDDGTKDSPDGYDQDKQAIVINTVMTDAAVKAIDTNVTIPGTPAYAEVFKGLTFIVPAGTGEITLNGLNTADHYAFHIMIGSQDPVEVIHNNGNGDVTVPYASSEASYVKIYLVKLPIIIAPIDAPAMKVDHRIGPKSSVGGALGGVKVSNSSVQSTADPAATYKAMEVATMAADIANLGDAYNGYSCNDPDITDLPDNLFMDNGGSSAPRRAGGKISGTILPEGLTFIDFSETKIMCMEVDREKGAFKGVPENVFIYMPAGNSFAAGTKNVVIGGICDVAELDGSSYAQPFKAKKDFKAGQATLKRTFEAGSTDSKATIYLPYNIAQEDANKLGTFYAYTGNDGTTVTMNKVTTGGLKANKPYIFEAKEGGVQNPMVHGVDIVANPAETEGFKGVYKRKNYESGMYCYAGEEKGGKYTIGQFVEMGPGSYVPPFRAYMIGNGAPSYAIAWDGEVDIVQNEENTTAVETVKTDNNVKTQDGWWTINGMRLKAQPKKAGLYILNGRMVVVK